MTTTSEPRRAVPSVDALLRSEPGKRASATFGRALLKRTLQLTLDEVRAAVESGAPSPDRDEILARAAALASYAATGIAARLLGRASTPPVIGHDNSTPCCDE